VVSESDLVTGEPNFQKRGLQFMALDTLELKKGARIVTGGNDLVIFANKIIPKMDRSWHSPKKLKRLLMLILLVVQVNRVSLRAPLRCLQ